MTNVHLSALFYVKEKQDILMLREEIRQFIPESLYVVAADETQFQERLDWLDYHFIIADYDLPAGQAEKARILAHIKVPSVPFIYLTGHSIKAASLLPRPKAVLYRGDIGLSGTLLRSIYLKYAPLLEVERSRQVKARRRSLLLQKFTQLQKGLCPRQTDGEALWQALSGGEQVSENSFPYYY